MAPKEPSHNAVRFSVLLAAALSLAWVTPGFAQAPGVGANHVGIDGDLLANSPAVAPFNSADDWLDGPAGPGVGLLDANGIPRDPTRTVHLFDPIDGDADEERFYAGNKVDDDPNTYRWTNGGVPQKDDIQNALIDFYVDATTGDLWVALGGDRRSTGGDSYIDFELLQNSLTQNPDGTFSSAGPDGGRTIGDVLLTIHLTNGGSAAEFYAQRWQAAQNGFDYMDFTPTPGTAFVAANTDSQVTVPFGAFGSTVYEINAFGEAAANLTRLIQLSGCYGINTVFIRTKSAPSPRAELKDFIEPLQIDVCVDHTPPMIACPPDLTIECDASTLPDNTGYATATDNCDPDLVITYEDVFTQGGCPQEGVITRTWTAADDCGNSASCVQLITIEDTTAPIALECPPDVTVSCTDPTTPDYTGYATATDNCDPNPIVTYEDEIIPGNCGGAALAKGAATVDAATLKLIAAARGREAAQALIDVRYVIVRSWTGTDSGQLGKDAGAMTCGNSAVICTQIITVLDDSAPVITCPPDLTIECDASTLPDNTGYATAEDDCPGEVTVTYEDVFTQGGCPQEGVITRTWTAADDCGNSASCVQLITIEDTTAPIALECPPDVTVSCTDPTTPDYTGYATATDNCDPNPIVTYEDEIIPGNCGGAALAKGMATVDAATLKLIAAARGREAAQALIDVRYVIVRSWTGTDSGQLGKDAGAMTCGNSAVICTQIITVLDDSAPVITCPPDLTIECDASTLPDNTGYATAEDDCPGEVTVTYEDVFTQGGCPQEGVITRTWTAADDCGNSASCVQLITIEDTTAPIALECPPDVTVSCTDPTTPDYTGYATATDNCDPNPIVTYEDEIIPGNCGGAALAKGAVTVDAATLKLIAAARGREAAQALIDVRYVIVRSWTGTDSGQLGKDAGAMTCGNSAVICTQIITVLDDSAPVITCPPDLTIECDASTLPDNTGYATAEDDCPGEVTVSYEDVFTQGGCPQEGVITRTWTAADDCGNSASCVQLITIEDTTAPEITCPPDVTVSCTDPTTPDYTGYATATDNCASPVIVTYSDEIIPGSCGGPPPAKGGVAANPTSLEAIAAARGREAAQALIDVRYVIVRSWTGTDSGQLGKDAGAMTCGNSITCTQIITVLDDQPPIIVTCPDAVSVQCPDDVPLPDPSLVTATDTCTDVTVEFVSDVSDGRTCPETITRTYRASDECGNSADCVQLITVDDTMPPTIECPADVILPCGSTPECGTPTASDNCDVSPEIILVSSETVPGPDGSTITTCTWEAVDDCGNASAQCSQRITVEGCPSDAYCSLTQGYYGNQGGTFNGWGTQPLIEELLSAAPLVVGMPGRSLTIPLSAAECIIARLPAGGNAAGLPDIGDATLAPPECQTQRRLPVDREGKFRNVLLGQTIALALNIRLDDHGIVDGNLAAFDLEAVFCTKGSLPGPDGQHGTGDDEIDPSSPVLSFTIPSSVLTALTNLGLQRDVGGLLQLANRALAGLSTAGASRSDINAAVDAINRGFDRCRFLVPCSAAARPGTAMQIAAAGLGGDMFGGAEPGEMPLGAPAAFELGQCFPNPFNPHTRFTLALPEATSWTVDVYDVSGHLVRRFTGEVSGAEYVRIEWDGTNTNGDPVAPGIYLYRAVAGNDSATRKAILLK